MSGAMYMTGTPGRPVKAAAPYVDFSTAVMSAMGVLAALMQRAKSGQGQQVEASLLHMAMAVFGSHLAEQGALGLDRPPTGNRVQTSAPSDVFATRDGHVLTHVVGGGLFARCARLLGRPEWLSDDALGSDQQRGNARDRLCAAMGEWCAARSTRAALEELQELLTDYDKQRLILSDEKKREREAVIRTKREALDAYTKQIFGPGGTAEQKEAQLIEPLLTKIRQSMELVATENAYDVIFTLQGIGYIKEDYDVTDKVLEKLNEMD